jgi:hypothetical protein
MNEKKPDLRPYYKITGDRNHYISGTKQEIIVGADMKPKLKRQSGSVPVSVNGEYGYQEYISISLVCRTLRIYKQLRISIRPTSRKVSSYREY